MNLPPLPPLPLTMGLVIPDSGAGDFVTPCGRFNPNPILKHEFGKPSLPIGPSIVFSAKEMESIAKTAQAVMADMIEKLPEEDKDSLSDTDTVTLQYELTDWYPISMPPVRNGQYELHDEMGGIWYGNFSGDTWQGDPNNEATHWRGIRGLLWPGVDSIVIPTT